MVVLSHYLGISHRDMEVPTYQFLHCNQISDVTDESSRCELEWQIVQIGQTWDSFDEKLMRLKWNVNCARKNSRCLATSPVVCIGSKHPGARWNLSPHGWRRLDIWSAMQHFIGTAERRRQSKGIISLSPVCPMVHIALAVISHTRIIIISNY